jgi:FdhD protein
MKKMRPEGLVVLRKPSSAAPARVVRVTDHTSREDADVLAAEEPMAIRLFWQEDHAQVQRDIAVTMRTPGDDFELAAGFLYGEAILNSRDDIADVSYCMDEDEEQAFNIVTVTLRPGLDFDVTRLERNFYTTSSCGVCGKASIEAVEVQGCSILPPGAQVDAAVLRRLPEALRSAQAVFEQTGGLHAAGLFDLDGKLLLLKEDVGRHNAVDKLIGSRFLDDELPLDNCILLLSGRASFELLQKAIRARVPVVAAVGAPSSLAVSMAESFNVTLAGFVKPSGFNLYSAASRVRI